MSLLDDVARRLGFVRAGKRSAAGGTVGYAAAEFSRLTASLRADTQFINTVLRHQLRPLRARARQAAQNNPFARRFAQMVVDNVAGPDPFGLEAKIKNRMGNLDRVANETVELEWTTWGKPGACEVTGKWSWNTVQRMLARVLAVDGEILVRKLRGPEYGRHGYRLQVIDVDRLWEYKNEALADGGAVHMSVRVDPVGKPISYFILKRLPAQWQMYGYTLEYEEVPADEIIHIFVPEHAEQVRGVPWMYAALLNLVNMGAFEEAAVIAARMGAAAMGVLQSPDGGEQFVGEGKDKRGDPQISAEPGTFPILPPGYTLESWNPKYPDAAVEPFIKAMLRGISAGLGVAYHNLANDLENVNYSSARIGELDERDAWMTLQNFLVEHLHQPIYDDWVRMATVSGALPFDLARLDKYRAVHWQPRRWAWVDPLKEVGASIEAIDARLTSRTRVAAESGKDIEDVFEELKEEQELAKEYGIDLPDLKPKATGIVPDSAAASPEDTATEGATGNDKSKRKRGGKRWDG